MISIPKSLSSSQIGKVDKTIVDQIEQLSKDPRWIEFVNKSKEGELKSRKSKSAETPSQPNFNTRNV